MPELLVLVPVLDRPRNVQKLMESHEQSKTPGDLIFVVTEGDDREIKALQKHGAEFIQTKRISWPNKIQFGYTELRQNYEWVLFGADDVKFYPDWFANTKPWRDQPEIMVIGTNDLGNPRVIAGDHATHCLVRSSYIGTVDDPDAIVHTGFRHWFVDDEFINTAKVRGCWAFCPTAIVEHLHPYWKKNEWDSTYAQGELNAKQDGRLWAKRAPLLGLEWKDSDRSTGYKV